MMSTYNLEYLKKISNNDHVFIREILNTFIESASEVVEAMSDLYDKQEYQQLSRVIHKFIPSLNFVGVNDELENDLNKLEVYLAKGQNWDSVPGLLEKAKNKLDVLVDCISREQLN